MLDEKETSKKWPGKESTALGALITLLLLISSLSLVGLIVQILDLRTLRREISSLEIQIDRLGSGVTTKQDLEQGLISLSDKINDISDNNLQQELAQMVQVLTEKINSLPEELLLSEQIEMKGNIANLKREALGIQNSLYNSFIQTMGGLFFFVTAFFAWRNLIVAQNTLESSEEKQVTERFGNAVEHLGSDRVEVRLGGVYELKRIAQDSIKKDYRPTIEILSGFIRERTRSKWKDSPHPQSSYEVNKSPLTANLSLPEADVEAALEVARNLYNDADNPDRNKKLDLRNSDFRWLLLINHDFRKINLGRACFYGSDLQYVEFNEADLNCADFRSSILNFANFSGAILDKAIFSEIDTTGSPTKAAELKSVIFYEENPKTGELLKASFSKASFAGVDLSLAQFRAPNFIGAYLNCTKFVAAILEDSNFSEANLTDTDFTNANLTGSIFGNQSILKRAIFINANLSNAEFSGANFSEVNLYGANLAEANLSGANLSEVRLSTLSYSTGSKEVERRGANFTGATLDQANFTGINLSGSDLKDASLTGTNFDGADLSNVFNLTLQQLSQASTTPSTKLPSYLDLED